MPIRPPALRLAKVIGAALLLIGIGGFAVHFHAYREAAAFVVVMGLGIAYVVRR